ncbi:hypothetical protein [Methylobrevis albus]|uniref:N-acetyltransferase domain-containing protein n=1 Tax=Methylobrevis albus TaxID=2793297 RepID=A0A931I3Q5_9HYPH|nr:hypothetical protein [Methylobrevis albus]MBH0238700.1 hypothetical protein [Methylobrevis albus]
MRHVPLVPGFEAPRALVLGGIRLAVLGLADLEPDFAAVTESEAELLGLFGGDWPRGLTRHDDAVDLGWHEREFRIATSFAWSLWAGDAYVGSAYIYRDPDAPGAACAAHWFRTGFADAVARDGFRAAWRAFVAGWPFERVTFLEPGRAPDVVHHAAPPGTAGATPS